MAKRMGAPSGDTELPNESGKVDDRLKKKSRKEITDAAADKYRKSMFSKPATESEGKKRQRRLSGLFKERFDLLTK